MWGLHVDYITRGDLVAELIVLGTLNMQVTGLDLSAASWLTM